MTVRARLAALLAAATALVGVTAGPSAAQTASGHPAGLVGTPIWLYTSQFSGYDVGANRAGVAYIGWISPTTGSGSTDRAVHLCRLPIGATSCTGGVQTIASLGISSAAGLRVLVDGSDTVHLVWFHDTDQSINGPFNGAIAEARAVHGLNLGAAHDLVGAPSFGQLLDAELGPNGTIWTASYSGVPSQTVYVWHAGAASSDAVHTRFGVGFGQLAFVGSTPLLAVEKYGAISTAPQWAKSLGGGSWTSFTPLANTWAVGTNAVFKTVYGHGLRFVTAVNNASYRPVIAGWTGSGFGPRRLTTDTNPCAPNTHDGWTDPSRRLIDASWECNRVTIANYPDAANAAIVRFTAPGTPTGAPQVASGVRGIATVAYTVEQTGVTGDVLRIARVRLADSVLVVARSGTGGRVTVTGPRSCLPPVNVAVRWTHRPASHWRFTSGALRLDGKVYSSTTLDGSRLAPGTAHVLTGRATFAKGTTRRTIRVSLGFTTCAAS